VDVACTAEAVELEAHGIEGVADAAAELRQAVAAGARRRGAEIFISVGVGEASLGCGRHR